MPNFELAAEIIRKSDAILIGAGAGMGVDSGLPDFRGPEGFWTAYPVFRGRKFSEISTPHWFDTDPALAWGFFGHRLHLYRAAIPHAGFAILKRWGELISHGSFVFTSNVDGQFEKAGFHTDQTLECHGSLHYLQCTTPCSNAIWPVANLSLDIDDATLRANGPLPTCIHCGRMARPNILMFNDRTWVAHRSQQQESLYQQWLSRADTPRLVRIEIGAGLAVPSVRLETQYRQGTLIRINPREAEVPSGHIGIAMGGLEALQRIDAYL